MLIPLKGGDDGAEDDLLAVAQGAVLLHDAELLLLDAHIERLQGSLQK